jgi:predicted nucleotidyltransferase
MFDLKDICKQITDGLNTLPRPLKVILFGSYARGIPHEDSDIDLLVILDRKGKSASYKSLIKNRTEISRRLRNLKKKYPMDVLVYTKDEWEELRASETSFVRKIEKDGIAIL